MKKKFEVYLLSPSDAKRMSDLYDDIVKENPGVEKNIAFREKIRKKKTNIFSKALNRIRLQLLLMSAKRKSNKK